MISDGKLNTNDQWGKLDTDMISDGKLDTDTDDQWGKLDTDDQWSPSSTPMISEGSFMLMIGDGKLDTDTDDQKASSTPMISDGKLDTDDRWQSSTPMIGEGKLDTDPSLFHYWFTCLLSVVVHVAASVILAKGKLFIFTFVITGVSPTVLHAHECSETKY